VSLAKITQKVVHRFGPNFNIRIALLFVRNTVDTLICAQYLGYKLTNLVPDFQKGVTLWWHHAILSFYVYVT